MHVLSPCALLALVLLAGCTGSGGSEAPVTRPSAKAELLNLVRAHYLWPETLPPQVYPEDHPTLEALLDHLTLEARKQGKDRSWSFVQAENDDSGLPVTYDPQSDSHVGYGMTWVARTGSLHVGSVLPGSGAELAGLSRGDEWLAVASTRAGLNNPFNSIAALSATERLTEALGPAMAGTTRYFRLRKAGTGAMEDMAVTQSRVSLDLVPQAASPVLIDAGGGRRGWGTAPVPGTIPAAPGPGSGTAGAHLIQLKASTWVRAWAPAWARWTAAGSSPPAPGRSSRTAAGSSCPR